MADKNYELLKVNPRHPSLQLKKVGRFWSVRIGSRYRALAIDVDDGLLWFWIGSHGRWSSGALDVTGSRWTLVGKSERMLRQLPRGARIVPAYLVVQRTLNDPVQYQKYAESVRPLIARFGGKAVARSDIEVLEGAPSNRSLVMFEFPSMDDLRAFWNSPEYVPVKKLRQGAAVLDVWAVPGT